MELTFLAIQVLALSLDLSGETQDVENTLDQVCEHPKKFVKKQNKTKTTHVVGESRWGLTISYKRAKNLTV